MLFPLWILFWLVFTSGLLFLDSDGFLWISLKWHCLEQKMSSEKRGPFFWFPKIFTVPKNHGASLRGRSGGEGSLRFHWDHHWLDQFFARWNQGTLPKWVRKGGRKLDFPVGCLFFFPQNRHVVPKISGKRDGKMIFKIRGRGIQGWSTTRIMFGFLLSNTLNTTQTLLSFFDAASANMSPPPLSCHSIWLDACHCQWKPSPGCFQQQGIRLEAGLRKSLAISISPFEYLPATGRSSTKHCNLKWASKPLCILDRIQFEGQWGEDQAVHALSRRKSLGWF